MTATYTFDIYSTLDGYSSYGEDGDWGGYWGKAGPEFLAQRIDLYRSGVRLVLGATTLRQFMEVMGPESGQITDLDPVNDALRHLPTTVISSTLSAPLDWPDAVIEPGDALAVVARLKSTSETPLVSHGSRKLNRSLMTAGLVDEVRITIFPAISGRTGTDPVFEHTGDFDLELLDSRTLDGTTVQLTYRPTLRG